MQVRFIGKTIKTDSIAGVGMRWEPGQIRNVTPALAEKLLYFTDTWQKVEGDSDKEEIDLTQGGKAIEEPLPVIDFHAMDKDALAEFAQTHYNEHLDKRHTVESLRHKVIALFGKHQADEETA